MPYFVNDKVREPLFAIVPVYNPFRWKTRWKHTERAIKHFIDSGAVVIMVEAGFNRRELTYADSGLDGQLANCKVLPEGHNFRHKYIGLHTKDELWLKENLINVGVQHLTQTHFDWQQICWLDSDVLFVRPNWVGECIHKLQHGTPSDIAFLQMFSQAHDVGPNYELLPTDYPHATGVSFVQAWQEGTLKTTLSPEIKKDLSSLDADITSLVTDFKQLEQDLGQVYYGPPRVFPGLAWACTRKAFDAVGGLFEHAIWGGGDHHMAHALVEKTEGMMRNDLHRNYKKLVNQWYERCRTHVRRNVLVMDGTVLHFWHGRKTGRGYNAKHQLLAKFGFDPLRHLTKDSQGLFQLHDDRSTSYVQLRDMLRRIAIERDEDSDWTGLDNTKGDH
jgi:hypothetical protein